MMRRHLLQAYEQGYGDGLREALAELLNSLLTSASTQKSSQPAISFPREYHNGFSGGLKDGTEVLLALGKTEPMKRL